MYKHILVPTDGSALSLKAARAAAKLAAKLKAKITALYVMPPYMPRTTSEDIVYRAAYSMQEYEKEMRKTADKALASVVATANGTSCATMARIHVHPWEAIIDAAYGVFMTGPSATADIEGVLIHGAQGIRSLAVVLRRNG